MIFLLSEATSRRNSVAHASPSLGHHQFQVIGAGNTPESPHHFLVIMHLMLFFDLRTSFAPRGSAAAPSPSVVYPALHRNSGKQGDEGRLKGVLQEDGRIKLFPPQVARQG